MKTLQTGILLALLLIACSPVRITTHWENKQSDGITFKKILVLGLIREADRSIQEKMEVHMVNDLSAMGYEAISSLKEYGPKAFEQMNETEALARIRNHSIDAVITIVLLDKKKERKFIPDNLYSSPGYYYYTDLWGYRSSLFNRIYQPGYYVTDTRYFWESNTYYMHNQQLICSVQTQSFDASNTESMAHAYGQLILKYMIKQKILTDTK